MSLVTDFFKNIVHLVVQPVLAILALSLSTTFLMAGWSSNPAIIYPPSGPDHATFASMAVNSDSNAVAVWFDTTGSGSLLGATLASSAVNDQGQPDWVLTNPIASSNVQDPSNSHAQAVGIDSSGNARAVWTDGTYVYTSTLNAGETTWSSSTIINTPVGGRVISNIYIAVAANGVAIVTWSSSLHPYDATIFANVFSSGNWLGQVNTLSGAVEFTIGLNPIAIDPLGNAIVCFTRTSNDTTQVMSYNITHNTWTSIPSLASNIVYIDGEMDASGNATVVWTQSDNTMNAATLIFNAHSFTNSTVLSNSVSPNASYPRIVVDESGNALAVWPESSGGLGSARYSFTGATWSAVTTLNLSGNIPSNISLGGDAVGNAVVSYTITNGPVRYIQSAKLALTDTSWTILTGLSSFYEADNNCQIVLTEHGDVVAIWENDVSSSTGTINSSIFLSIFAPLPPSQLTGRAIQNKFLIQTDRINELSWQASQDNTTTAYHLYRNNKLIATIPSASGSLTYQDHRRSKNSRDTYKVMAINANDKESTSLSVTVTAF